MLLAVLNSSHVSAVIIASDNYTGTDGTTVEYNPTELDSDRDRSNGYTILNDTAV